MASSSSPALPVVILSDSDSESDGDGAELSRSAAEFFTSFLCTQAEVDALCKKHGIPAEFAARPAGERHATAPPPAGAVCVYAHALESGLRFPLHPFFSAALSHYGIPPGQLTPNGWRLLVAFVVLCHSAGVPPSLVVFRYFFIHRRIVWCSFRCRKGAVALFTGLKSPKSKKEWKRGFFFLTSPEPWPCPVRWNEDPPSRANKAKGPVLSSQDEKSVAKLLQTQGAGADLRTYLSEADLAAALSSHLEGTSPPPPPLQPSPHSIGSQGMDLTADDALAPAEKMEAEPVGDTPQLSGMKRKREEDASANDGLRRSELNTPPAATAGLHAPPGSDPNRRHWPAPDTHDGDSADWEEARKMLERSVPPERAHEFAVAKPSDVVEGGFVAMHQAVNHVVFSLDRALELEKKQKAHERDIAALREQLRNAKSELSSAKRVMETEREKAKAELAAARRATEAEVESAKTAAVQQFLGSKEYTRRVAEQALAAYERGAEVMKLVALQLNPRLDAAKLVLPVD